MIENAPTRLAETNARIGHLRQRDIEVNDAIGDALVSGSDVDALRDERRAIRDETEDLHTLAVKLEEDIQAAKAGYRLQIAKAEQRVLPLKGQLTALLALRVEAFEEGLRLARLNQPKPDFADTLTRTEANIEATEARIAEAEAETEAIRALETV